MMKDTATERAYLGNSMETHLGIVFLPTVKYVRTLSLCVRYVPF